MKRLAIVLGILVALGVGGYFLFKQYAHYLPGLISNIRDPIADTQPVTWAQGPTTAPDGERAPNIIVIVADDLGFN
ncbi:MAG: sulfatase, partial [Alphaproteobacteria bacterium]